MDLIFHFRMFRLIRKRCSPDLYQGLTPPKLSGKYNHDSFLQVLPVSWNAEYRRRMHPHIHLWKLTLKDKFFVMLVLDSYMSIFFSRYNLGGKKKNNTT